MVNVEIVYCEPDKQWVLPVSLKGPGNVKTAICQSGILQLHPHLHLESLTLGIFSKPVNLDTWLKPGDRIEIYRPLSIDPKQARRKRARSLRA